MLGGSGKLGRGGGGSAAAKRNVHAPPIGRPSPAAPTGRLSLGGGPRGRGAAPAAAASAPSTSSLQVDESFNLVRENPLNFAMAIKLAPDLVEEIKRVESQGGTARIRFNANSNNPNGNVINVGDKNFKFIWSRENADLCDIYEERQSGEDGNGLLVESGSAWRKLNVQRVLDESTKNHVKMRSEEAERKHKSRKAIVLDHQNASMKSQMKALQASESNSWRNFKQRKEPPFKKPKSEPPPAVGPPTSVFKSGFSTTTPSKGKLFLGSPLSSRAEQYGVPASPVGGSNLVKGHISVIDVAAQNTSRSAGGDKEMHSRPPTSTTQSKSKPNQNTGAKPADLRSLMISLLKEHQSSGMSLKALEKAIGDASNSARQIEPILKQIAIYQAPGRYFLKPGVEMESFKKQHSESGSYLEITHHASPEVPKFDQQAQDPSYSKRTAPNEEEQAQLNSTPDHALDTMEKVDILRNSPDHRSDRKVFGNSGGLACSSSDSGSGSDSESDSSDTGSESGSPSRSKSQSPAGSQSGNSSDSESDVSSSSKQASDEDVDIMTSDDDKGSKHKLPDPEPVSSKSPVQWRHLDSEYIDIGNYEKQDEHVSDVFEIEKDSPEDRHQAERAVANHSIPNKVCEEPIGEIKSPINLQAHQQRQVYGTESYGGPGRGDNDDSKHHQLSSHEKISKGKSKRRSDDKDSDERLPDDKRLKSMNLSQPVSGTLNLLFGESPSPDRSLQGPGKGIVDEIPSKNIRDDSSEPSSLIGFSQGIPRKPIPDAQQPGQRSFEASRRTEASSGSKRLEKQDYMGGGVKNYESSLQTGEGLRMQKGSNAETQHEDVLVTRRMATKTSVEDARNKHVTTSESHHRTHETSGKVKEAVAHSNSFAYSPRNNNIPTADKSPMVNGRGRVLRREHSDLELGELREPLDDENSVPKRQFERIGSFKELENRQPDSECLNSDSVRGKPSSKLNADSRKSSPPISEANISGVPDKKSKKRASEHYSDDLSGTRNRANRPPTQQHQSWVDNNEIGTQQNGVLEMSGRGRFAEAGTVQGAVLDNYGDSSRKRPVYPTDQQHDPVREVGPHSAKENRKQKPRKVADANGRRKDASLTESNDGGRKRRESSSDENTCSYSKYEKNEPELKGPIRDFSEYREYVKEYREKYESYCSLNKMLESYRDEFSKLGKDLEVYRDRDVNRYNDIVGQIMSSYRRCGERHKRLKKIFTVLYEELKNLKKMISDFAAAYQKD